MPGAIVESGITPALRMMQSSIRFCPAMADDSVREPSGTGACDEDMPVLDEY